MSDLSTNTQQATRVTFDIKTFFTLLGVVIAGVATTISSIYSVQMSLREELIKMDQRWIDRTAQVEERLRLDIRAGRDEWNASDVHAQLLRIQTLITHITERLGRLEDRQFGKDDRFAAPLE